MLKEITLLRSLPAFSRKSPQNRALEPSHYTFPGIPGGCVNVTAMFMPAAEQRFQLHLGLCEAAGATAFQEDIDTSDPAVLRTRNRVPSLSSKQNGQRLDCSKICNLSSRNAVTANLMEACLSREVPRPPTDPRRQCSRVSMKVRFLMHVGTRTLQSNTVRIKMPCFEDAMQEIYSFDPDAGRPTTKRRIERSKASSKLCAAGSESWPRSSSTRPKLWK